MGCGGTGLAHGVWFCTRIRVCGRRLFGASILLCSLLCALFQMASRFVTAFMFGVSSFFPAFLFCGCVSSGRYRGRGGSFPLNLLSRMARWVYGRLRVGCLSLLGLGTRPGWVWFVRGLRSFRCDE